jgi:hypothetical protein
MRAPERAVAINELKTDISPLGPFENALLISKMTAREKFNQRFAILATACLQWA